METPKRPPMAMLVEGLCAVGGCVICYLFQSVREAA
jgi:hypothetical protein